jgi:hypothetical protein
VAHASDFTLPTLMSALKFSYQFILFLVGMTVLNLLCEKQTDGFFPYQISASQQVGANKGDERLLKLITSQPFSYLGKGHQCFVFESQDHQYVLKLPFHSQIVPPLWLRPVPFFSDLYRERQIPRKKRKLNKAISSHTMAFEQLHKETAVVYIHLRRTSTLQQTVPLIDKIGVQHLIDLDRTEFILQKKGEQLYPTIEKWMEQGEIEQAKAGLSGLITLFYSRYRQGIEDKEKVLNTNYGFLDGHAMQIDIGRLRKIKEPKNRDTQTKEIRGVFAHLHAYLKERFPELADHLEKEIENLYSDSFAVDNLNSRLEVITRPESLITPTKFATNIKVIAISAKLQIISTRSRLPTGTKPI